MLDVAYEVETMSPNDDERVSIREAMRRYPVVAYHRIRYAINSGRIPSWRVKNRILIRVSDVQMLAAEEEIRPNIPPKHPFNLN